MRCVFRSLLLLCAVWLAPVTAFAADPQTPLPLPQSVQDAAAGTTLQLLGYGHFRKLLWDVFDASLWVAGERWSVDQAFALELRYARDFDGADIVDSTRDQWKHLGYTDPARINPWLERLTVIFPDIKKGDRLTGLHLPGRETRFFHNGKPIGTVSDPAFGPAFFAIWLDPKSSHPSLREELLGSRCAKPATVARTEVKPCGGATMPRPSTRRPGADQP
ncbi:MAG: chalcone isomerase family protein [Nevskiales bacterium]